ncbi:MAG: hypothetical protein JEZ03_18650 [Bacteroidales bacterium]|nr:hypothetical protein [Bacteroidales bacterium]
MNTLTAHHAPKGARTYELKNHLGNVLATVSDRKDYNGTNFSADITSSQDYYPFGMQMPGRTFSSNSYRYGFNGMEKDDEIAGAGNSYTAEFWQYDSRLGRRWNVDPVVKHDQSRFSAFANNPIWFIDPNGADTAFSNNVTKDFVNDLIDSESDNYNEDFANHMQTLVDDNESVYSFDKWDEARRVGGRATFGEFSADGRNEDGQNLINIGFSLESSNQGHMLGALFEETDHAVQFHQGRLGFVEIKGVWTTGDSYDLNDEVDNKIWTANALNSFGDNSDYKRSLMGLQSKIVRGASRRYITRKVGIHYGHLPINSTDVFQAIRIMTSGVVTEEVVREAHMRGVRYDNLLIGTPRN